MASHSQYVQHLQLPWKLYMVKPPPITSVTCLQPPRVWCWLTMLDRTSDQVSLSLCGEEAGLRWPVAWTGVAWHGIKLWHMLLHHPPLYRKDNTHLSLTLGAKASEKLVWTDYTSGSSAFIPFPKNILHLFLIFGVPQIVNIFSDRNFSTSDICTCTIELKSWFSSQVKLIGIKSILPIKFTSLITADQSVSGVTCPVIGDWSLQRGTGDVLQKILTFTNKENAAISKKRSAICKRCCLKLQTATEQLPTSFDIWGCTKQEC